MPNKITIEFDDSQVAYEVWSYRLGVWVLTTELYYLEVKAKSPSDARKIIILEDDTETGPNQNKNRLSL